MNEGTKEKGYAVSVAGMEVCHIKEGAFRERARKPKAPEKTYFGSAQHPKERQEKENISPFRVRKVRRPRKTSWLLHLNGMPCGVGMKKQKLARQFRVKQNKRNHNG